MASLGLDVGGSKCRYAFWPDQSRPGGEAPTVQPAVDGVALAVERIAAAIAAGCGATMPDAIVCASAGVGDPAVRTAIEQGLRARVEAPLHVVGDTLAAAAAGLAEGPGLLLWSGTGSFCVARGSDGALLRGGGRGFAFGDEGSGYDLVRRAIVAVLRAIDGRGRETKLARTLPAALGAPSPERLGATAQVLAPGAVAAALPVVLEALADGDQVALDVVTQGMHQLVELAGATARRAGLELSAGVAVALGGGVLEHSDLLQDGLRQLLHASFGVEPAVRVLPQHAAARGAAWLADGVHHGLEPQTSWVQRVAL